MISMDEYFGLTLMLLLVFGAVFELPLVLSVLSLLGVVSAGSLWRFNRYAVILFAIAGAVLTPGDLVVGQLMMTGSLTVLYNLSIIIAWLVQRRRTPEVITEETTAGTTEPKGP
jgi:sec-independent protein translocase protein TatC